MTGAEKPAEAQFNWTENPFTFRILPDLFVGYRPEIDSIVSGLNSGTKFSLIMGPTGAGKTTLMKHLIKIFSHAKRVKYLPKPPKDPQDFIDIFLGLSGRPLMSRILRKQKPGLYDLSAYVNDRLNGGRCVLFVDECHEASLDTLEWLRTLTDQTDNLSLVMAGLPIFDSMMRDKLETFTRRFTLRIELSNLTKSETRELIKRRIENAGGEDIKPFTQESLGLIYERTGGFPREVIRLCGELALRASREGISTIDNELLGDIGAQPRVPLDTVSELPHRQRVILESLGTETLTPSQIADRMDSGEYKNRANAIRSVNNILKRMMKEKLVARERRGKTYRYKASGKVQPLMVQA
jgi:type II secretory pathway predicted ATPase ExeA